jgi:uncharacterized protein YbaR (Trm112 family)
MAGPVVTCGARIANAGWRLRPLIVIDDECVRIRPFLAIDDVDPCRRTDTCRRPVDTRPIGSRLNMKRDLVAILCCPACQSDLALHDAPSERPEIDTGTLACTGCDKSYPIVRGVPRFVDSDQYAGSFSYEWNRWNRVQLDIANGRRESEETFAEKT